ncbi:MAG: acetylornithine/succinylornithine family transaminase [candidate division NC10 bacterium]|nr:acetylornithine/succinylornithine family transaminase [candidate division NC10 bacterium]
MNLKLLEDQFSVGVYQKRDLAIIRGQAARVWDEAGREYIDCVAGVGVANVGHCNPAVVKAIQEQAARLITCNELFYNDARARCLDRLNRITPEGIDRFFLCNSGTEAVEGAIKFARMATGRTRVVAAMRGYHGKTLGSLSATWDKKYRDPFTPLVPDFIHVPYNNAAEFEKAIDDQTAAVILEPVQGEGGVRPAAAGFFRAVRKACDDRGALFIIDEIQTGFGRTGRMFACEHFGVLPDILTMAKGIAGGIPMGAIGIDRRVGELEKQSHTSTFGGNPLACAAAVAAMDFLLERDLPNQAAVNGGHFMERLRGIRSPRIREVRGLGLMIGVELKEKAGPIAQAMLQEGVLVLLAGSTVLRFLPPLVITRDEIDAVVSALAKVLASAPGGTAE